MSKDDQPMDNLNFHFIHPNLNYLRFKTCSIISAGRSFEHQHLMILLLKYDFL